jgi:SAM-dependent methyltransferase
MADYALDNSWDRARRRLSLLEQYLDPLTKRRMTALGIHYGLRCLEVGAGGGSVAVWLCEQVGPSGGVVATDIDIQLLGNINLPNFEAIKHDITVDSLPESAFDFVHARWLLHHLPKPELVIRRMIDALRPGGWLLLEDVDFFPVHTSASQLYVDFMVALTGNVVRASGRDCFWARALPGLVAGMGLLQVGGEGDFSVLQGGSPVAEFFSLTAEQMRERIIGSGELSADRLDEALGLLKSPDFWAFGGGGVAVWGQRPK